MDIETAASLQQTETGKATPQGQSEYPCDFDDSRKEHMKPRI
jgi:hypothetical protein